jgi:pyruvate dehydrogenase E1 component beta subunit
MRKLSYVHALNEALRQILASDEKTILIGQGVNNPWYVGRSTVGLGEYFGYDRVIDTPVSEACTTGVSIGAALASLRPILVFPRMDFMYLALDQIANHAANWNFMFGGQRGVPMVIWAIINRGGEQAAQHSQAIQSMFAHIPGLKVVAPSSPHDIKGAFISSINDGNPVIIVDDRWLYDEIGDVPENMYSIPIDQGQIIVEGCDVTIAASSYMTVEAVKAAKELLQYNITAEVIDLRSLKPIDENTIITSVCKTGHLVIADGGWKTCGVSAEVAAIAGEKAFFNLKAPILRVTLADAPAPASSILEKAYYPKAQQITSSVMQLLKTE